MLVVEGRVVKLRKLRVPYARRGDKHAKKGWGKTARAQKQGGRTYSIFFLFVGGKSKTVIPC